MKPIIKKVLKVSAVVLGAGIAALATFVWTEVRAFDTSMARIHEVPYPVVQASQEPQVLARGKHLSQSLGGCASGDCHGTDLSGGRSVVLGPLGTLSGPNITPGGVLGVYSDAELARLLRYGIKKDGRSVRMMPVQDFSWLDDRELLALVSYLRQVPRSEKPSGTTHVGILGKVFDRQGKFVWDVARRVASLPKSVPPAPAPDATYGSFVARLCTGCHGETLSGGPIPGAPPSIPTPANITFHPTGIKHYTLAQFSHLLKTGQRPNGTRVNPFMAVDLTRNLDDTEVAALWSYLQSIAAKPSGGR